MKWTVIPRESSRSIAFSPVGQLLSIVPIRIGSIRIGSIRIAAIHANPIHSKPQQRRSPDADSLDAGPDTTIALATSIR